MGRLLSTSGTNFLTVSLNTGTILSVLNPKLSLLWSNTYVQIEGVSDKLQHVPVSQPISFYLGPLHDYQPFLLSDLAHMHLSRMRFPRERHCIFFLSQRENTP